MTIPRLDYDDAEFKRDMKRYKAAIPIAVKGSSHQILNEILDQEGLREYPPESDANQPPTPFYIRGVGIETGTGNLGNSERYGTGWEIEALGNYGAEASNATSYGKYMGDPEEQAEHMERLGWITTKTGVRNKLKKIGEILSAWMNRQFKKV